MTPTKDQENRLQETPLSNSSSPHIMSPYTIRSHTFKNRLVMGSMHTGLEESWDGYKQLSAYFEARAKGGAGLIITGGYSPNFRGNLSPFAASFQFSWQISRHRRITEAVHKHQTKIFLQILHAGRYSFHPFSVSSSSIKSPITPFKTKAMSERQILNTINDFSQTAVLAKKAGYDGVEIMGSEGYLINQFLAARTNHRTDNWGGNFEKRTRFANEIVKKIREKCGPNFLICFRISLLDLVENGSTSQEVIQLANQLINNGVDLFDSGIGWHESKTPTIAASVPDGAFIKTVEDFTQAISGHRTNPFPVIATNRLHKFEIANQVIENGKASFVSLARPWLADSDLGLYWTTRTKNLGPKINFLEMPCISCNQACLDHIFVNKRASCIVNPLACHEIDRKLPDYNSHNKKTKIAIVGAGVAGLSCAEALLKQGYTVDLVEKENRLGGQFNLASKIPSKERMLDVIEVYKERIEKLGGQIILNKNMTFAELKNEKYDSIIFATGVVPRRPDFKIEDSSKIYSYSEWLNKPFNPEIKNLVILGGGGIAFDVAHRFIHDNNNHSNNQTLGSIKMLTRSTQKWGSTLGKTTGWILKDSLKKNKVQHISGVKYHVLNQSGLTIETVDKNNITKTEVISADAFVLCIGQNSENEIYQQTLESKENLIPIFCIGGAKNASEIDAKRSVLEGYEFARTFSLKTGSRK